MSELHRNSPAEGDEERLGFVHENLEGWIPSVSTDAEIREALEKAFDYRGDLTITLKSGQKVEGYLFDRKIKGPSLAECFVRLMPKDSAEKISIAYSEVAALAFSGRDTAAGKSFAAWVKKYNEKKAAGEANIGLEAESLE
jgi:hypothetical protein